MKPDTVIKLKIAALFALLAALYPLLAYAQTKINLATQVQGTLPVTNGGTGFASITANRIPYATASNTLGTAAGLTYDGTTFTTGTATVSTGALTVTGGTVTTGATTALSLATTGGTQLQITNTASAARNVSITGSAAGNPSISTTAGGLNIAPATFATSFDGANSGAQIQVNSSNTSNTAGSHAYFRAITAGSSGGNPTMHFLIQGIQEIAIGLDNSGSDNFVFSNSNTLGTQNRLEMTPAGAFRWNAYGAGTLTTDASGNITAVSDPSAKRDIRPFTRGLADVLNINPILHGYTPESGLDQTRADYAGFDAVNVQKAIPEAVGKNPDDKNEKGVITRIGYLTLNHAPIIATIVNAIKEMNKENQSLRARVTTLEARLTALEARP